MIYIQKPDGTILTWLQKIEMFAGWGINIRWNNIFTSGNATQNMYYPNDYLFIDHTKGVAMEKVAPLIQQ